MWQDVGHPDYFDFAHLLPIARYGSLIDVTGIGPVPELGVIVLGRLFDFLLNALGRIVVKPHPAVWEVVYHA